METEYQLRFKTIRPISQRPCSTNGFTLIEMLITLAVLTILIGLSVAGMQSQIERSQSENTLSELRQDLVFSRGEAVKRGGWVGICGSDNANACSASYQNGWLVFHDVDKDGVFTGNDSLLSFNEQDNTSLAVSLEETGTASGGPLMFNYRGYPDREVVLRVKKGDADNSFIQLTTGSIQPQ